MVWIVVVPDTIKIGQDGVIVEAEATIAHIELFW